MTNTMTTDTTVELMSPSPDVAKMRDQLDIIGMLALLPYPFTPDQAMKVFRLIDHIVLDLSAPLIDIWPREESKNRYIALKFKGFSKAMYVHSNTRTDSYVDMPDGRRVTL